MEISKDLIANRQVFSFEYWDNYNNDMFLLSVTKGMSTATQRNECMQKYYNEKDCITLNERYFKKTNIFELWHEKQLIGLCNFLSQTTHSEDAADLRVYCELKAVFILEDYRGKGIGSYFSGVIRNVNQTKLLGSLVHNGAFKKVTSIQLTHHSDYESIEGEAFHESIFTDDIGGFAKRVFKILGVTFDTCVDAGY